jgi:hypothetical protein
MKVLRSGEQCIDRRTRSYYSETLTWFSGAAVVLALSTHLGFRWPGLAASALLFVLGRRSFDHRESWLLGQRGETRDSHALRLMPEDYVPLNDLLLPDGTSNRDHFLSDPNGFSVAEAENYFIALHLEFLPVDGTEKELLIETIPLASEESLCKTGPVQW